MSRKSYLRALEHRLTPEQQARRDERIVERAGARMIVARTQGQINIISTLLTRGFWGWLKWLIFKK